MLVRPDGLWATVGGKDVDGFARDGLILETGCEGDFIPRDLSVRYADNE